jgi:hypothetical protein
MKIYYKVFLIKDLETNVDINIDKNTIISISSSLEPYKEPNTILVPSDLITKIKLGETKIDEITHFVVDNQGFCPLYLNEDLKND